MLRFKIILCASEGGKGGLDPSEADPFRVAQVLFFGRQGLPKRAKADWGVSCKSCIVWNSVFIEKRILTPPTRCFYGLGVFRGGKNGGNINANWRYSTESGEKTIDNEATIGGIDCEERWPILISILIKLEPSATQPWRQIRVRRPLEGCRSPCWRKRF